MRKRAEAQGTKRIEGKVVAVNQDPESGFIESVQLENGTLISADLFIDCSGFRALLIEGTLHAGFEDWTHWLPCDRALVAPCEKVGPPKPYTGSTAHQGRLAISHSPAAPDRQRSCFSSQFSGEDEAADILLKNLDGKPLGDPKLLKFTPGISS